MFVAFVFETDALSAAHLLRLKERKSALEAEGRSLLLHEIAREENLMTPELEGRIHEYATRASAPTVLVPVPVVSVPEASPVAPTPAPEMAAVPVVPVT